MRVGIDEAGRGPVLGPLVVAGVAVDDEDCLVEIGVKDSKKLTASRREQLAPKIRSVCAKSACVVLSAADVDDGRSLESLNRVEASAFAAVARRLKADDYYLDAADVSAERFARLFLQRLGRSPPPRVVSVHKADALHPVVSAASILAKVERDRIMRTIGSRLERELGQPAGSGYPSDPTTVAFLKRWVAERGDLPPETRASWRPAQLLVSRRGIRALDSF